jgi:hypothetical protein
VRSLIPQAESSETARAAKTTAGTRGDTRGIVAMPSALHASGTLEVEPDFALECLYDGCITAPTPLSGRPWRWRSSVAAAGVLGACAVVSILIATRTLDPQSRLAFGGALATVVAPLLVTGLLVARTSSGTLWRLLISPFSIAAVTWLVLFVLRPLELAFAPEHAASSLGQFGFRLADLTRTVALGALGIACWCFAYLAALSRPLAPRDPPRAAGAAPTIDGRRATVVLAVGTLFWGLLFLRQGGVGALVHHASSLRADQSGSFYGFIGVWIVQGLALYALAIHLQAPTHTTRRVLVAAALLAVATAFALQLRGLVVFAALAALLVHTSIRPIGLRGGFALAALAVVGVLFLGYAQKAREYSARFPTGKSVRLALETPLPYVYVSDLGTFDNFAAIQSLVPSSIPYLHGQSLWEIPGALVPRGLWPEKPKGIDVRVSSYLYPHSDTAVPISVQGELYWNEGVPAVALGGLLLGFLMGALTRVGRRAPAGAPAFVVYATLVPFTHAFLTRGLATMTENLVFALVGLLVALTAVGGRSPRELADDVQGRLRNLADRAQRPRLSRA